ncbi:glycosyl transferase [Candidatus Levyibacteriota bacterium]|nr:glycosyl transferase [Candidatus Levybacteria bacterium]
MSYPKVTILIPNYNGKKWLAQLLPTVEKITYPNIEILVVNNGSTDDSGEFLKKNYPKIRVLEIKKNCGYAGANNAGVEHAKGEYVLLLNNDTQVSPGFLEPLVDRITKDPTVGAVQPQIRNMVNKNLIDSIGSFFTFTGFLYHYGYFQSIAGKKYQKEISVYSVKGACFLMKKKDYIHLGGIDERFVTYVEESDLCHRILLTGKKIIYTPKSHVYHFGGGDMHIMTKSEVVIFRSFRNRFISYIKNLGMQKLLLVLPVHFLLCELLIFMSLLRGKFKQAIASQIGVVGWIPSIFSILKQRQHIQAHIRKISDDVLFADTEHNPSISYYSHFFFNPEGKFNEQEI